MAKVSRLKGSTKEPTISYHRRIMTDKQIIIDGVDVSGCPYYIHKDGSCSSHDCECIKCIDNVCFYKDYKAKDQECEELKRLISK